MTVGRKRRKNDVVGVAFKVDADLWRRVQESAEKHKMTLTRYVEDSLEKTLTCCDDCIFSASIREIAPICERALK